MLDPGVSWGGSNDNVHSGRLTKLEDEERLERLYVGVRNERNGTFDELFRFVVMVLIVACAVALMCVIGYGTQIATINTTNETITIETLLYKDVTNGDAPWVAIQSTEGKWYAGAGNIVAVLNKKGLTANISVQYKKNEVIGQITRINSMTVE